jgi:membrane-bound lytic murein transglycosylase D
MRSSPLLCLTLTALLAGCATHSPDAPWEPAPEAREEAGPLQTTEIGSPAFFNPEMERLQKKFDSALAFFAMGDLDSTRQRLAVVDSSLALLEVENLSSADRRDVELLRGELAGLRVMLERGFEAAETPDSAEVELPEVAEGEVPEHEGPHWPYDVEVVHNAKTEAWIEYFTGPGRQRFQIWLDRSKIYEPLILEILDDKGLPRDLQYLALIESGYNPRARSRSHAVGAWQFIAGTGRIFGLRIDWWVDERRDIVASTWAACHYLSFLYEKFESWPLALAAYNCGERRVERAMRIQQTRDFWSLRLPRQTRNYVPKVMAAVIIGHNPEEYGFTTPEDARALEFDVVGVSYPVELPVIAKKTAIPAAELSDLNPALLRGVTPPNYKDFPLKVPSGRGDACREILASLPESERVNWVRHTIRRGETVSTIASRYDTSIRAIVSLNGLRNPHRIRAGGILLVPSPGGMPKGTYTQRYTTPPGLEVRKATTKPYPGLQVPAGYHETVYRVRRGDTLGEIAEWFGTRASTIRRLNNLAYRSYIYPGQELRVFARDTGTVGPGEGTHTRVTYEVKRGDTLYGIGKKYNITVGDLVRWNNRSARRTLFPGEVLIIWVPRPQS